VSNNDLGFAWMGFGKLNNIHIYKVTVLPYRSFGESEALQLAGFFYPLLRCLVFGELCGREFATLDVACVDFRKMLPLFGQVVFHKNG
jgi:hypothetical protein